MPDRVLDVGILTDEVSRDLAEALDLAAGWGLRSFELREGAQARFPGFTKDEIRVVEDRVRDGVQITAVSPGIFKGPVHDTARLDRELQETLPRALDLGVRFGCPVLIAFGFERYAGDTLADRAKAMRAFERLAEAAHEVGMTVALENEPNFWIDRPEDTVRMLEEIGHPSLRVNWDPANTHWGGRLPGHEDFSTLLPYLANVHVKDYYPADPEMPWRPVGEGSTPWREIIPWIASESDLPHVTVETHCEPLEESSRRSVAGLRDIIAHANGRTHAG